MIIRDSFNVHHRFLREEAVCGDGGDSVHDEVVEGSEPIKLFYELTTAFFICVEHIVDSSEPVCMCILIR